MLLYQYQTYGERLLETLNILATVANRRHFSLDMWVK